MATAAAAPVPGAPARVLVVDDSVVVRQLVARVLEAEPSTELAGVAPNGRVALEKIARLHPDVVLLDLEMPEMDGFETLVEIRRIDPDLPVIIFSYLTSAGAAATLDALALGATGFALKPSADGIGLAQEQVHDATRPVDPGPAPAGARAGAAGGRPAACSRSHPRSRTRSDDGVGVVVGVSTGGPNALATIIAALPAEPVRPDPGRAAHAGAVHQPAGRAAGPVGGGPRGRGRRRRAGDPRPGVHRPGRAPPLAQPGRGRRRAGGAERRCARELLPPGRRRALPRRGGGLRAARRSPSSSPGWAATGCGAARRYGPRAVTWSPRPKPVRSWRACRRPSPRPGWPTPSSRSTGWPSSSCGGLWAPEAAVPEPVSFADFDFVRKLVYEHSAIALDDSKDLPDRVAPRPARPPGGSAVGHRAGPVVAHGRVSPP